MRYRLTSALLVGCLLTFGLRGEAALDKTLAFQGRLTDVNGQPLDGVSLVTFRLFETPTGGIPLWDGEYRPFRQPRRRARCQRQLW